jgi:hypothetical protein
MKMKGGRGKKVEEEGGRKMNLVLWKGRRPLLNAHGQPPIKSSAQSAGR